MTKLIHFLGIVGIIFMAGCAGTKALAPDAPGTNVLSSDDPVVARLIPSGDGKLARKNTSGETVGVGDDGWEGALHYYGEEKKPFTGNLLVPHLNNGTNSVQAIIGFENGQQHGTATVWDRNGTRRVEENFEDGKLVVGKYWLVSGEADPKPREAGLTESAKLLARLSVMALTTRGASSEINDENSQFDRWLESHANAVQKQRHQQCVNELTSIYMQSGMSNQKAVYRAYCWIRAPQNRTSFISFIVHGFNPLMGQNKAPSLVVADATGSAWMKFIDAERKLTYGRYANTQSQLRDAVSLYSSINRVNVDPILSNHILTGVMLARKGSSIYSEIAYRRQMAAAIITTSWLTVHRIRGRIAPVDVVLAATVLGINVRNMDNLGAVRNEWLIAANYFDSRSRALADVFKKKYHRLFHYPF